jgi:hypothetical protein
VELGNAVISALAVAAVVLAALAVVLSGVAIAGQRRVRRTYRAFSSGGEPGVGPDVLSLLRRHVDEVAGLRDDVRAQRRHGDELSERLGSCLSRVATVRYDAFDDMGGRMSFSSALLDEHGDGLVVSAINGRTETRIYAKPVRDGSSRHHLSEEELEAVRQALSGSGRADEELRGQRAPARVVRGA